VKSLLDSINAAKDALSDALADAEALELPGTYQLLDESLSAAEAASASLSEGSLCVVDL
jgi:hypothetical protein